MACGPELLVHITAGNIPSPAWLGIVLGLLVRSAQFVKCASGTSLLPRLFAHSLYEVDSKLASCLEIAEWKRLRIQPATRTAGSSESIGLTQTLIGESDCV